MQSLKVFNHHYTYYDYACSFCGQAIAIMSWKAQRWNDMFFDWLSTRAVSLSYSVESGLPIIYRMIDQLSTNIKERMINLCR